MERKCCPGAPGPANGLLGLPLAFCRAAVVRGAAHYASNLGLPLASVGALQLAAGAADGCRGRAAAGAPERSVVGPPHRAGRAVRGVALRRSALGWRHGGLFSAGAGLQAHWRRGWWRACCSPHTWRTVCWSLPTRPGRAPGGDTVHTPAASWPGEGAGLIGVVAASALSVAWGCGHHAGVFALAFAGLVGWRWQCAASGVSAAPKGGHEGRRPRHRQLWQPLTKRRPSAVCWRCFCAMASPAPYQPR